jgi:hypothetical protein
MPDATALSDQIELVKTKIDELSASALDSQDLVFLAKALEAIGNLLGVNDIVGVTNESILSLQAASSGQISTITNAGSQQINAVITSGQQQIFLVESAVDNYALYVNMGVI